VRLDGLDSVTVGGEQTTMNVGLETLHAFITTLFKNIVTAHTRQEAHV
jgi:hypothetical protein